MLSTLPSLVLTRGFSLVSLYVFLLLLLFKFCVCQTSEVEGGL